MPRDLPAPTSCKACPAMVRWALRIEGWKNIPLEVDPDPQGEWVPEWDDQLKQLLALPFDFMRHGGRERYRSHLSRCRLPQQPGPSSPTPPRADATAGMKFPKRRPPDTRRAALATFNDERRSSMNNIGRACEALAAQLEAPRG